MHNFNEPQVEWQHSPLDTLLGSTAQALSNTPSFFYELLYNEPVNFQGMKSLFQSITFSVMSYRREKQAERIILCLL